MPTYVYRRPDGTTFDVFQKISDPALTEDPQTGEPVQRVISGGAGLQFKGDGFYLTDYARKGSDGGKAETTDGASSEKESASSKATPSDPKPAASPSSDAGPGD